MHAIEEAGVPCGPVNNYEDLFNDPQIKHRQMVVTAHDDELGEVRHVRVPIKMGDSITVRTVAPKLGQHNAEVFGSVGRSEADIAALKDKGVI